MIPPSRYGTIKAGVEADHRGEKIKEAVVIVPGHLPVPGNLYRLKPDEIAEKVRKSEGKRRPSTDRPKNGGGIPAPVRPGAAACDPMGDRGGKEDQRDGEKPGGNSELHVFVPPCHRFRHGFWVLHQPTFVLPQRPTSGRFPAFFRTSLPCAGLRFVLPFR